MKGFDASAGTPIAKGVFRYYDRLPLLILADMSWFRRTPNDTFTSKLPPGDLGSSFVGNTFTFHSDAQSLILSSLASHPEAPIIRAKVIGRDVALVMDHAIAASVLDHSTTQAKAGKERGKEVQVEDGEEKVTTRFSHREAYKQLIGTFFVEPNILLEDEDEPDRSAHRAQWDDHMDKILGSEWPAIESTLRTIIIKYRETWTTGPPVDIYEACKDLSHDLVFRHFLGLDRHIDPQLFGRALALSDASSRGQFSVPVKANLGGMFESAYSKGLRAQEQFNGIVLERIEAGKCPFLNTSLSDNTTTTTTRATTTTDSSSPSTSNSPAPSSSSPSSSSVSSIAKASAQSHTSMFSSSLVIKALSSYLTFAFLQTSRNPTAPLNDILLESERLSPPIIGVLRRVLDGPWRPPIERMEMEMEIPVGWDVWLYFPLINRDTKIYGDDANLFRPERWKDPNLAEPMSFGRGGKRCIGREMVRRIGRLVLDEMTRDGLRVLIEGDVDGSLQDFLGWRDDTNGTKEGWKGVKQLPVQRPRERVMVRFER